MNKKTIDNPLSLNWADQLLNEIIVDSPHIIARVELDSNTIYEFAFINFISIIYVGRWDESVIHDIYLDNDGELIEQSLSEIRNNYGENPMKGLGYINIDCDWKQINIELIDGVVIKIVCEDIECKLL